MKRPVLNPWAIATLACLCFLFVAADSIGPNVPSLFSRIISTNKTADAWRSALSVPSATSLTTVSNAQVATAANLVTVSNAQVTTAGNLVTVSNAQITTAGNLVTVSNAQVATAANLVTVSNAQVTTAGNLVTVSNAQITTAGNLTTVSNAQIATAANLVTVSNAQVTTDGKLAGYMTNNAGTATNAALTGGTMTSVTNLDLTASRVMVSDANKVPTSSSVTAATLGYLDATSSVQTQLDSKPTVALTNVARLDQSQTFTQTNTFSTRINGNGAGLTNLSLLSNRISRRAIWSTNNIFLPSLAVSAGGLTNNGDLASTTVVFAAQMPPLLSSNALVLLHGLITFSNLNSTVGTGWIYCGTNTNYLQTLTIQAGNFAQSLISGTVVMRNCNSFTNQFSVLTGEQARYNYEPNFKTDTSTNWWLYMGFSTVTSFTNLNVRHVAVEVVELD